MNGYDNSKANFAFDAWASGFAGPGFPHSGRRRQAAPGFFPCRLPRIAGDQIEHLVMWKRGNDVSKLSGQPVRLRFIMKDADLYSFQFTADE